VEARGFAQANLEVTLTNNPDALRFVLQPGNVLRLRIQDANGKPVTNGSVYSLSSAPGRGPGPAARPGRGVGMGPLGNRGNRGTLRTDAEGRVVWESSPDSELRLNVEAVGFEATNMLVPADGAEHVVTLASARATAPHLTITGSVRDAASSLPIPNFVLSVNGSPSTPSWMDSLSFQGGKFQWFDNMVEAARVQPGQQVSFKLEAQGYAPFVTRAVGKDEGNVQLDIALTPAPSTTVTVLLPDGRPATNADIGLELPGNHFIPMPGGLRHSFPEHYTNVFSTDDQGRFALPPDDEVIRVIVACPDGYAEATPAALAAEPILRLQRLGRIEGTLFSAGKPAAGRMLALKSYGTNGIIRAAGTFTAETDADGRFAFPEVPPGEFVVLKRDMQGNYRVQFPGPPTRVRPGETAVVNAAFYTVTAQVSLPPGVELGTDRYVRVGVSLPSPEQLQGQPAIFRNYMFRESSEGAWVSEDLTAGDYTLAASVIESDASDSATGVLGLPRVAGYERLRTNVSFTVPADPSGGALNLGRIMPQPVP
jgi:hypothetical protein